MKEQAYITGYQEGRKEAISNCLDLINTHPIQTVIEDLKNELRKK